jgi:hypothetical protein
MRHITWVPLLAALSAIAALVVMTGGARARNTSCPAPCLGGSIGEPMQWIKPGGYTKATFTAIGSGVNTVTVTGHLDPLMQLVRKGSSRYTLVNGNPVWKMYRINGQKSIHFVARVRKTARRGKRMTYVLHVVGKTGTWSKSFNQVMFLHVAPEQ